MAGTGTPPTGRLLGGRYRVGRPLGRGGAAEVYLVRDELLHVDRAAKLIHFEAGARGEGLRSRLATEARTMAGLRHPNILRVTDLGVEDDLDFIVMELAEAGNLSTRAAELGPMPLDGLLSVGLQILSALAAAHAAGVIHRDVKPQNLLLSADGRVQLADFGIALIGDAGALRLTRTGAAMGSLAYMAPEQRLDASRVGPAADLYAAGATLFALATVENPVDLFLAEPESERWLPVPPALRPVLQRATQLRPEARYPSAATFAEALAGLRGARGPDALGEPAVDALGWLSTLGPGGSRSGGQTHQGPPLGGEAELVFIAPAGPASMVAATIGPALPAPPAAPPADRAAPPADRAATAPAGFSSTLAPVAAPPAPTPTSSPSPTPPPFWLRPRAGLALAAIGLLAVILALWATMQAPAPPPAEAPVDQGPAPTPPAPVEAPSAPPSASSPASSSVSSPSSSASSSPEPAPGPAERAARPSPAGVAAVSPAPTSGPGGPASAPRAVDAARPAGEAPAAAGPGASGPSGEWTVSFNGNQASLRLSPGRGAGELNGELVVRGASAEVRNRVVGRYDPVSRAIFLQDTSEDPDAGRYELRLEPDGQGFAGSFSRADGGRVVRLSGRRAR